MWERDAQHRRITVTVQIKLLLPIGAPSGCGSVLPRHNASSAEGDIHQARAAHDVVTSIV